MARVWRNYFQPPSSAPPPDAEWLRGVRSRAILATRAAALKAEASRLTPSNLASSYHVAVLFGGKDIYGSSIKRLLARFPHARHVTLEGSGHLPWLQSPKEFREEILAFFG